MPMSHKALPWQLIPSAVVVGMMVEVRESRIGRVVKKYIMKTCSNLSKLMSIREFWVRRGYMRGRL